LAINGFQNYDGDLGKVFLKCYYNVILSLVTINRSISYKVYNQFKIKKMRFPIDDGLAYLFDNSKWE